MLDVLWLGVGGSKLFVEGGDTEGVTIAVSP